MKKTAVGVVIGVVSVIVLVSAIFIIVYEEPKTPEEEIQDSWNNIKGEAGNILDQLFK